MLGCWGSDSVTEPGLHSCSSLIRCLLIRQNASTMAVDLPSQRSHDSSWCLCNSKCTVTVMRSWLAAHSTAKLTMQVHWSQSLWVEGASIPSSSRLLLQVDRDFPDDIRWSSASSWASLHDFECRLSSSPTMDHSCRVTSSTSSQRTMTLNVSRPAHTFHRPMGRLNEHSRQQSAFWSRKTPLWHCWATAQLPFLPP